MEIYLIKDGDLVCVDQEITAEVFEGEGYIRYAKDSQQVKKLLDKSYAAQRIEELLNELKATDYKVIKCYESFMAEEPEPYDFAALKSQRDAWREEINELEVK